MNRPDNKQARKWANEITESRQTNIRPDAFAAAELIQSLPGQWVDAEEIQKWYDQVEGLLPYWAREDFKSLIAPKLPTLAELIEVGNNPEDYQWAWVDTEEGLQIITMVGEHGDEYAYVMDKDGYRSAKSWSEIRPRPDLQRFEWPGSRADAATAESAEDVQTARVDDVEPALPNPEDVPPGEAWLIKANGKEKEAIKTKHPHFPWSVSGRPAFEGRNAYSNAGVTLISRLVPKTR